MKYIISWIINEQTFNEQTIRYDNEQGTYYSIWIDAVSRQNNFINDALKQR